MSASETIELKHRGFTIWELLIILFLVAVVGALIYPALQGGRLQHFPNGCLSQVKQMSVCTLMYASDSDDRWPQFDSWMDGEAPYIRDPNILRDAEGVQKGGYGYAFRAKAAGINMDVPVFPANYILIFDSSLQKKNATSELWSLASPGRHKGNDTVSFADGHTRSLSTVLHPTTVPSQSPLVVALLADEKAGPK